MGITGGEDRQKCKQRGAEPGQSDRGTERGVWLPGAGAGMGSQPLMQREAGSSTNGFQNTVSVLNTAELSL